MSCWPSLVCLYICSMYVVWSVSLPGRSHADWVLCPCAFAECTSLPFPLLGRSHADRVLCVDVFTDCTCLTFFLLGWFMLTTWHMFARSVCMCLPFSSISCWLSVMYWRIQVVSVRVSYWVDLRRIESHMFSTGWVTTGWVICWLCLDTYKHNGPKRALKHFRVFASRTYLILSLPSFTYLCVCVLVIFLTIDLRLSESHEFSRSESMCLKHFRWRCWAGLEAARTYQNSSTWRNLNIASKNK